MLDGAPASPPPPAAIAVDGRLQRPVDLEVRGIDPVDLRREDHERLHRHPVLPCVGGHARPDGQLHRPRRWSCPAATKDYFSDDNGKTHEANINRIAEAGHHPWLRSPIGSAAWRSVSRAQMAAFLVRALRPARGDEGLLHRRQQQLARSRDQRRGRGRPDRWLRQRQVLPDRPRSPASRWPRSCCGRSSPTEPADAAAETPPEPTSTTPYQSQPGPSSGCPRLTLAAYGERPATEAVLRLVRRRSATTVLAVLLLATSVIPATAATTTPEGARAGHRRRGGRARRAASPAPSRTPPASARASTGKRPRRTRTTRSISPAGGRVTVPFRPASMIDGPSAASHPAPCRQAAARVASYATP